MKKLKAVLPEANDESGVRTAHPVVSIPEFPAVAPPDFPVDTTVLPRD